jgi:hypothetical protein
MNLQSYRGILVKAVKSPVNICQLSCYPIGLVLCAVRSCILDVNRTASSIPVFVFVFAGTRRQGGTNTNVGGSLAKTANCPKN